MSFEADDIFDFTDYTVWFCTWKVNFVDDRENVEVVVKCEVYVCQSLSFDSLSCVYYEDGTVAGCETSGNFVVEVYVAWGVDEVEDVFFAVAGFVDDADCLGFDGDSTFSFEIHVIEDLGLHFAFGQGAGHFDDSVS